MSYELLRTAGQVVSFETKPNAILPLSYPNVTVDGILGYDIARLIEDVSARYQQLLPYLPAGTTSDFTKVEYVAVRHVSGELEVLALNWIEENSIKSTQRVNKTVKIYNVSDSVNEKIIAALSRVGIKEVTITNG